MTLPLILTGLSLAALLLVLARARRERAEHRRQLHELHERIAALARQQRPADPPLNEYLAVLAHELRSPLSAIIGYGELLAEGALGPVEPRATDAINRMRRSADQLLRIIEGIEELFSGSHHAEEPERVSARDLLESVADVLREDAESRGATVTVTDADLALVTRVNHARRCLILVLAAALKASQGAALQLSAATDDQSDAPALLLKGSMLEQGRDDPDFAPALSGAGLRIGLARRAAVIAGGSLMLESGDDGTIVTVILPQLTIDAAEDTP